MNRRIVLLFALLGLAADWGEHPENQWVKQSPTDKQPAPLLGWEGSGAFDPFAKKWIHFGGHDGIPQGSNPYLPHGYTPNCAVYTGTHDNDTTRGWYAAAPSHVRDHLRRYFRITTRVGSPVGVAACQPLGRSGPTKRKTRAASAGESARLPPPCSMPKRSCQ